MNNDLIIANDMIKIFHYQLKSGAFFDRSNGYPTGKFKKRANQVSDVTTENPENVLKRIINFTGR